MFAELTNVPGDEYYPYSNDLLKLIEYGSKIKIHPVYVVGLDRDQLHSLRNTYTNPDSRIRVGIYGIYDTDVLVTRLGIEPTVIILAEHIKIQDDIATFIKRNRTPVLRLMKNPVHLHQLCHEDYYGGVYETMDSSLITDSDVLTYMINLGILIWLRNHGERKVREDVHNKLDLSGAEEHEIDTRGTAALARDLVFQQAQKQKSRTKPESSWDKFASKQMEGFVPDSKFKESFEKINSQLTFRNQGDGSSISVSDA